MCVSSLLLDGGQSPDSPPCLLHHNPAGRRLPLFVGMEIQALQVSRHLAKIYKGGSLGSPLPTRTLPARVWRATGIYIWWCFARVEWLLSKSFLSC